MSSYPKKLTWNKNQLAILEMLGTGVSHHQISKNLGLNISTVVKVSHAIKKGQSPATPYVPKQKKAKSGAAMVAVTHSAGVDAKKHINAAQTSSTETANGEDSKRGNSGEQKQEQQALTNLDSETEARLVTVPVVIPITQIMQNWRAYLVKALNWPADSKWQDIIDTTIYRYALAHDPPIILQGWYVADK